MLNSVGYLGVLQAMEQQNPVVTENQENQSKLSLIKYILFILTLLVISEGDPAVKKEEPVQTPSANAWAAVYAKEIIDSVKRIDDYIDELPGIHLSFFFIFYTL